MKHKTRIIIPADAPFYSDGISSAQILTVAFNGATVQYRILSVTQRYCEIELDLESLE